MSNVIWFGTPQQRAWQAYVKAIERADYTNSPADIAVVKARWVDFLVVDIPKSQRAFARRVADIHG